MYKKLNQYDGGINVELDIIAHKEDEVMGYCESCGQLLLPKEGRIQKYEDFQKLFCNGCYDLVEEMMMSHV